MTALTRTIVVLLTSLFAAVSAFGANNSITVALTPDGLSPEQRVPLQHYLTQYMGRDVKLVTLNSYTTTLDSLASGSVDFACLGAVTYVRGRARLGLIPLVQRESDLQFHSLIIANSSKSIYSLSDLKGKQFAFGDINSTSGHVIPYLEMKRAGLNPDADFQVRYSGEHSATVKLVEMGIVDAGAVDESVFNAMIKDGRADRNRLRVIHTSQPFVDYVYVARRGMSDSDKEKFAAALLALKEGKNDDVLKLLRASKFVKANDGEYSAIREAAQQLKLVETARR
ncbi:MAG TPA: phosphate/phosphite/phosphonate ABC transporter substrate-binding protein [Candidatus Angelobacter sp.]|jgi:phosphonate transport system substrate-binding protein|nr:phosphate/phosphite/phosphonate ABC transporter substrate-binding protein [Candidatus Angelobacter sp.]